MTTILAPICDYCLQPHDADAYCPCGCCGIEMHPQFIHCITLGGVRLAYCPACIAPPVTPHASRILRHVLLGLATLFAGLSANAFAVGYFSGGDALLAALLFLLVSAFLLKARQTI